MGGKAVNKAPCTDPGRKALEATPPWHDVARALLGWSRQNPRDLPWLDVRTTYGAYGVWVAEVLLQQTTVAVARTRYPVLMERWPRVEDLASASLDDVLGAWSGLGYYARARNLHATAVRIVEDFGGVFPHDPETLQRLPGVGAYTASAVAALAFDHPAIGIDTNVRRVLARLGGEETPSNQTLQSSVAGMLRAASGRELQQALIDFGAVLCTARHPGCGGCPLRGWCRGRTNPRRFPAPRPKPRRHFFHGWALVLLGASHPQKVLMRRRPVTDVLGGTWECPGEWQQGTGDDVFPQSDALERAAVLMGRLGLATQAPLRYYGTVRHRFSHRDFSLHVFRGVVCDNMVTAGLPQDPPSRWVSGYGAAGGSVVGASGLVRKILDKAEVWGDP